MSAHAFDMSRRGEKCFYARQKDAFFFLWRQHNNSDIVFLTTTARKCELMDYFGPDEVIGWDLHASSAIRAGKVLASTIAPPTSSSPSTVLTPFMESMKAFQATDLAQMPLMNSVDLEVYDRHSTSLYNDSWVQLVITCSIAFTVIFFVIFVVVLASCTLSSSTTLVPKPSNRRRNLILGNETNPMLASSSV